MKKLIALLSLVLTLGLVGCSSKSEVKDIPVSDIKSAINNETLLPIQPIFDIDAKEFYVFENVKDDIKEGFVFVRNPMNAHQISRIDLRPDVVDGIVFWTKNPLPMLDRLDLLKEYTYYFQFTLTSYGEDVESNIPSKSNVIIPSFQRLSDKLGPKRVHNQFSRLLP